MRWCGKHRFCRQGFWARVVMWNVKVTDCYPWLLPRTLLPMNYLLRRSTAQWVWLLAKLYHGLRSPPRRHVPLGKFRGLSFLICQSHPEGSVCRVWELEHSAGGKSTGKQQLEIKYGNSKGKERRGLGWARCLSHSVFSLRGSSQVRLTKKKEEKGYVCPVPSSEELNE